MSEPRTRFPRPRGLRSWLLIQYLRLPEHPGKLRIVNWIGRYLLPREGVVAKVEPGIWMHLHPADWVEFIMLRDGSYDGPSLRFIERNVRSGATVIVTGVNFGLHLAVAARAAGEKGRVVGIEPQPRSLLRTRANLALNREVPGMSAATLVQAALMARDGVAFMPWSQDFNHGAASFFDPGKDGLNVQCRPLSGLLADLGARHPRMIVLDIQGSEMRAFEGFDEASWPEILLVRCDAGYLELAGETPVTLFTRLRGQGYELFDLAGQAAPPDGRGIADSNLVAVRPAAGAIAWS